MQLLDHDIGITVDLGYDDDGFPIVTIDTGGGYMDNGGRPAVAVHLNDKTIHPMFAT